MLKGFNFLVTSLILLLAFSPGASAYYSVLDSGELQNPGHYKLTGAAQFLNESGGANLDSRMDVGINEKLGVRGILGFGYTNLFLGALLKGMILPERDEAPLVALSGGLVYVKDGVNRDLLWRFEPNVSKRFELPDFNLIPYASLPLTMRMRTTGDDHKNDLLMQLVAGTQVEIPRWKKNLQFIAEVGLNLTKAPGFISIGAILYFDSEHGVVLE